MKIFNKELLRLRGRFLEVGIYAVSMGLYGLSSNSFVSWWGKGLSGFQVKVFTIICMTIGVVALIHFFSNCICLLIKYKSVSFIKDVVIVFLIWFSIIICYIVSRIDVMVLPSGVFIIMTISFILYLEYIVKKIDEAINLISMRTQDYSEKKSVGNNS